MRRNLQGSRILITGASSGIGKALGEAAAARGARVGLAARSAETLQAIAKDLAARQFEVEPIVADVANAADRKRMLDAMTQRFGGLDVLVNNAGVASFGHFIDSSEADLRRIMEVNFFAAAELIRLAAPLLMQSTQPAVVNVCSMCGRRGMAAWPEYSASKFAMTGLSESLAAEFVRFGIHVLLVLPGLTRTGLRSHMLRDAGRMKIEETDGMAPEWVAEQVWRALERNKKELVLGSEAKWIIRLNRWMPRLVDRLVARKVRKLYAEELAARAAQTAAR